MNSLESTRTINDIQYLIQEKLPNNKIQNNMYVYIEMNIIPEYKETEESSIKPAPSTRKSFLTKDSDTEKKLSTLEGILPEEEGGERIQKNVPKKRSSSVSKKKFSPKKIPLSTSPEQSSKKTTRQALSAYKFEFNEEQKEINLMDDLSIESQEESIRKQFDIEPSQPIIFIFINEGEEASIKDIKQPMKTFKEGIIRINHKEKINPTTNPVQKSSPSKKESKIKPKSNVISKDIKNTSSKLSAGLDKIEDINSFNKIKIVKKGSQNRRSSSAGRIQRKLRKLINPNTE